MASDDEDTQTQPHSEEDGMWPVIEILAEKNNRYRVQWEGIDPTTGKPWAASWVLKSEANDLLVQAWKEKKALKSQRRRSNKPSVSKTKPRANGSNASTSKMSTSDPAATSISAHNPQRRLSTLSISSTEGSPVVVKGPRKRRGNFGSKFRDDGSEPARPNKKRKIQPTIIIPTPSPEQTQSTYEIARNKRFGTVLPQEEEEESQSVVTSLPKGKGRATTIKDQPPSSPPLVNEDPSPTPSTSTKSRHTTTTISKRTSLSSFKSTPKDGVTKPKKVQLLLPEEEEETTQEAAEGKSSETTDPEADYVPHLNLLDLAPAQPKSRRRPLFDKAVTPVRIEDISIAQSEPDELPGVHFDLPDEYDSDTADLMKDNALDVPTPPLSPPHSSSHQRSQPTPPSTPTREIQRSDPGTGSLIISRMKANQSTSGPPSSPTTTGTRLNKKPNSSKDKQTKPLRPLPKVTPSKFAPHIPQDDAPMSSIEDFTPDKTRSRKGKNVSMETEDILDHDDSAADDLLQQRGHLLAEQAAAARRQERGVPITVRKPFSSVVASSTGTAEQEVLKDIDQADQDILQEMADTYVDFSGGYPDETPAVLVNGATNRNNSEELELPPTDSIQANTDSQTRSQDSDLERSQQLREALTFLHEKSEEIESLQQQLSEALASLSAAEDDRERLQSGLEEQIVHNEVIGGALAESKDYTKSLEGLVETSEQKQADWEKRRADWEQEKKVMTRERDEDRARLKEQNKQLLRERSELAKQRAEMEEMSRAREFSGVDSSQRQSELETEKKAWDVEKLAWLEKEKLWAVEKAEWQKKAQSWDTEREQLVAAAKSAEKDSDFFRTQYSTASSFADTVRVENVRLEKQNEELNQQAAIAHGQAKYGVQLIRDTYELRLQNLEEELEKARHLCDLLRTKDERTNDEIRRRAAAYPELEDNYERLRKAWEQATGSPFHQDQEYDFEPNSSLEYEEEAPQLQEQDEEEEVLLCLEDWCGHPAKDQEELREHCEESHGVRKLNVLSS